MHDSGEAEHFGVHFQRRDRTGGDDDGGKAVEDGFDCNGGVKAGEMENWVGNCGGVGLIGFEDQEEAFVVCCCEGGEGGDFLERLVVFDIC